MASRDGGKTWRRALPPGLSRCTGGSTDFTGDPFVSIGADGTAYLVSVPVELPLPSTTLLPRSWIAINRSSDHGATWSNPVAVAPNDGGFWDKGAVTADPRRPGVAYAVFLRRTQPDGSTSFFASTRDRGRSFSAPLVTIPDQQLTYPHDPQLLVLPGGTLVQVYVQFNDSYELPLGARYPVEMRAIRSSDGGAHWSQPTTIAQAPNEVATDPDSGQLMDTLVWPSAFAGRDGTIYTAWVESAAVDSARVVLSKSTDAGRAWTRPATVARVPAQAWLPTVAVDTDGTVGVMWYDARSDRRGDNQFTAEVRFAHSTDGGATWQQQARLGGPFDMLRAGRRNTRPFLGDYFGLAPVPDGFAAAFVQAPPRSGRYHSVVFYARVVVVRPRSLRLSVRPRRAAVGRRTTFRFSVRAGGGRAVSGALIRFAGRRVSSGRGGRGALALTLGRRGSYRARAVKHGFRAATASVRAVASSQPDEQRADPAG
jgi:hypothetical protein